MNHGDAINYIRIFIFWTNVEIKNLETALFQIRIVNECLHVFFFIIDTNDMVSQRV